MAKHKRVDISDEDIDSLFNNNDTSVLKDVESSDEIQEEPEQLQQSDIVPKELSLDSDQSAKHVDRPDDVETEAVRIRRLAKEKAEQEARNIEENIADVKQIDDFLNVKKYIQAIRKYVTDAKTKQLATKNIISGNTNVNLDAGTECTFHMYEPKHIMGDTVICSCRYCSAMKEFTQKQWDEWCIKYRKWM